MDAPQAVLAGTGYECSTTFTQGQYEVMFAAAAVGMFALLAGALYAYQTRNEVAVKYRPSATVSALICTVAFLSYAIITLSFVTGFSLQGGMFVPNDNPLQFRNGYRYLDWLVTVPLLVAEFLAVLSLVGARARNTRAVLMAMAVGMIVTGFLGAEVFGAPDNHGQRILWGTISTLFWAVLLVVLGGAVKRARDEASPAVSTSLGNAQLLLLVAWSVYPVLYLVPLGWFPGSGLGESGVPEWSVTRQVLFTLTDVVAKVGFGALIHKIAKMKTAEDVNAGRETHDEAIYLSHDKLSEPRPALAEWLPARPVDLTDRPGHDATHRLTSELVSGTHGARVHDPRR